MFSAIRIAAVAGIGLLTAATSAPAAAAKPTILLVHGAFAESNSWNGVISRLTAKGYPVIAVANPLRGLKGDAAALAAVAKSVPGNVLFVGHSYGGEVISEAVADCPNAKGLVFVAGVAPDVGESASSLGERFPGSTLGATLAPPVELPDGGKDLYIALPKFWHQFAADVPETQARLMAVGQRPATQAALSDLAVSPGWKQLPSWFIYGSLDRNITWKQHAFMAQRAKAREAIQIKGASHVVMVSHPAEVAALIERAATAVENVR